MQYLSTRDSALRVSAQEAIVRGLAPQSGLFVPETFPQADLDAWKNLSYPELAEKVLAGFLTDYSADFLHTATASTYGAAFGGKAGETVKVRDGLYSLELWHGPTCAFKDYALQLMPKLLVEAKKMLGRTETTRILVATSGDTGKAALVGYADLDGIEIEVFYPNDGTSEIQHLQMATQKGENVQVYAVQGNFDDAQTGVKKVFADADVAAELEKRGIRLSSANSINWGRLVPQIVYYFYAYFRLAEQGAVEWGKPVDFCVPTGNFGDILAAYYAKRMGLPVNRLICASNSNNVLTDFLRTGIYDRNRPFHTTISPSMDILISSNLERLIYTIAGCLLGRLLFGGGNGGNHPPVLAGSQLPHRPPYRRGGGGAGAVPRRFRGRDSRRGGLHRQPLQILRERAHRHRGDTLRRRTGAAGSASCGQRCHCAPSSGGAERKVPPL